MFNHIISICRYKLNRLAEIAKEDGLVTAIYRTVGFLILTLRRFRVKYLRALYNKKARDKLFWDEDYRYNYNLPEDSVVFDLGGYNGEFTERFLKENNVGEVHIFEPVPKLSQGIREKFKHNKKVTIYDYGLEDSDRVDSFKIDNSSSSLYLEGANTEVEIKDIVEVIDELQIEEIDLMKINIEGAEFALLERLISAGYIDRVKNIQVQFHNRPGIENCIERHAAIQEKLEDTHKQTYEYYFTWEHWTKKE